MNCNQNQKITETQTQKILQSLLNGETLDGMKGLTRFGTMKISSRVSEIKKMNFPVQCFWKKLENGKLVKAYRL